MKKSLAREVYDTRRRTRALLHAENKKRRVIYGDPKPTHPRKKSVRQNSGGKNEGSGLRSREGGEIAEADLVQEIEGTGGWGSGQTGPVRSRIRATVPRVYRFTGRRLPGMTASEYKRARHRFSQEGIFVWAATDVD